MRSKIPVLGIVSFFLLQGCNGPTSITAFDDCLKRGKEAGSISASVVKAACIKKHESKIPDVIEGNASYSSCFPPEHKPGVLELDSDEPTIKNHDAGSCEAFEGEVKNTSTKYIVTSATIRLKHAASSEVESHEITLWLEPGKSSRFIFRAEYRPTKANPDDLSNIKGQYKWWTSDEKGFVINY